MNQLAIDAFWELCLTSRMVAPQEPYDAWGFGDSPEMADELGALVASGVKTATCSALWAYEADEALPELGELSIVLNGAGEPLCLIKTTEIVIKPYNEVDASFAFEEGEGDRTLAYWREAHKRFFTRAFKDSEYDFTEDMPLVCERFRVMKLAE